MKTLTVESALAAVRKNLDEQGFNESVMYSDENEDNKSLDLIVAKLLPEAINDVNSSASVETLEGSDISDSLTEKSVTGGVVTFSVPEAKKFLRLVKFKASDTDFIVTEIIAESSPEGRKQLNPAIRGTWDRPRLVQMQGNVTSPTFKYYSLKDAKATSVPEIEFYSVQREEYDKATIKYEVSSALFERILCHLTALILAIYGEGDKSDYFEKLSQQK